ncbi:MAG: hypothetical protein CM1200mP30_18430 [Pseudomonadota bacterium]|nr:MAG: hypothetical protein CM1200mP30_18430 [Pseudomonadota bacterium]
MITSTEKNNNTPPNAASATTDLNGIANCKCMSKNSQQIMRGCQQIPFLNQKRGLKNPFPQANLF